jgi:hypothetical protein
MSKEQKLEDENKALHITRVVRSASVDIVDSDIATIEALHDLLLDHHGYKLDFITLKRARELTAKMYAALYPKRERQTTNKNMRGLQFKITHRNLCIKAARYLRDGSIQKKMMVVINQCFINGIKKGVKSGKEKLVKKW